LIFPLFTLISKANSSSPLNYNSTFLELYLFFKNINTRTIIHYFPVYNQHCQANLIPSTLNSEKQLNIPTGPIAQKQSRIISITNNISILNMWMLSIAFWNIDF